MRVSEAGFLEAPYLGRHGLEDLQLDRQSVAVPSWHEAHLPAERA